MMKGKSEVRALRWALVGLFGLTLSIYGCGDDEPAAEPVDAGPDTGVPTAYLDANLPQEADVSLPPSAPEVDQQDYDPFERDYSREPNSIKTCGDYFACTQECAPGAADCRGACHDAMTPEAESRVQAFVSCVGSYGCSDETCIMRNCGQQMERCFNHRAD